MCVGVPSGGRRADKAAARAVLFSLCTDMG